MLSEHLSRAQCVIGLKYMYNVHLHVPVLYTLYMTLYIYMYMYILVHVHVQECTPVSNYYFIVTHTTLDISLS